MNKNTLLTLLCLVAAPLFSIAAQSDCNIPIAVVVDESVPAESEKGVANVMTRALSSCGLSGDPSLSNFCLKVSSEVENEEVIAGTRPTLCMFVNFYFEISNLVTGEKFSADQVQVQGTGANATQAYSKAVSQLRNNKSLDSFAEQSREKIMQYYDTQLSAILNRANMVATQEKWDEALWILSSVPECVSDYSRVEDMIVEIYQERIDRDCTAKLQQARAAWSVTKDAQAAQEAIAILAKIHPASKCNAEIDALIAEIATGADEALQRQLDELAFQRQIQLEELDIRRAEIEAGRAVGIAYGENQVPLWY